MTTLIKELVSLTGLEINENKISDTDLEIDPELGKDDNEDESFSSEIILETDVKPTLTNIEDLPGKYVRV